MTQEELIGVLRFIFSHYRLPLTKEKATQKEIQELLEREMLVFTRERRFSSSDIVDFFFPVQGLAMEVKLRANKKRIYKQLERYAQHDEVTGLLLLTNTAMGLPEEIAGKPTYYISLGGAWM